MKYYTAEEIAYHNSQDDCWVSIFNNVYDLTSLLEENKGPLAMPLIEAAGTSISNWFNEKTGDVRTYIDPERNISMPYTPHGRFIHVLPPNPIDNTPAVPLPWWKDSKYLIGSLTLKRRKVKIINMMSRGEDIVSTCKEETISEIRDRYMEYNLHASSYTWKALINDQFIPLNMDATLEKNGLPDETEKFIDLNMDEDFYVPTLHIYFNDDLTYA